MPGPTIDGAANRHQPSDRIFFPNLDGLRFAAFLLVYIQHGFGVPRAGGVGVAFFFVLSGFLITYLMLAEIDQRGRLDVRSFYIRRILRIWPLYYVVLVFCFLLYPTARRLLDLSPTLWTGNVAWYVFFLSNFDVLRQSVGSEGAMSVNVTWSVAIEEQFYLTWPLVVSQVPRRYLRAVCLVLILASLAFRALHAGDYPILYFHSASVMSDMAIGGLAAESWRASDALRRFVVEAPRAATGALYLTAVALVLGTCMGTFSFYGPIQRLLGALVFAAIVLEQNFCASSIVKMSWFTRTTGLGRITYGLYLLHAIVLTILSRTVARGIDATSPWFIVIVGSAGLLVSVVAARLSYRWFERPLLALKGRFAHVRSGDV